MMLVVTGIGVCVVLYILVFYVLITESAKIAGILKFLEILKLTC